MRGVKSSFHNFIFENHEEDKSISHLQIATKLVTILQKSFLKPTSKIPRKILVCGPPGSGRTIQA